MIIDGVRYIRSLSGYGGTNSSEMGYYGYTVASDGKITLSELDGIDYENWEYKSRLISNIRLSSAHSIATVTYKYSDGHATEDIKLYARDVWYSSNMH